MKTKLHIRLKTNQKSMETVTIDIHPYFISRAELTKAEKVYLMKSHYLAPRRLVKTCIEKYINTHESPPFKFLDDKRVLVFNNAGNTSVGKDFYIDEVTLTAWKTIIMLYDCLKQKNQFEDFLCMLSDYPKYRVVQFIEEFAEFNKNGANAAWYDLRSQVEDVLQSI